MNKLKVINITLCIVAICCVWLTDAVAENKCVATFFFSLVICFWLAAKGKRRFNNYKFLG